MKKYTVKDYLGNKKTIYAKDLVHALKLTDTITYRGFKIYKVGDDWEVESRDGVQWNYDGSMTISEIKKYLDKGIDKGIWDSRVKDNLDNDIYNALVEVSKNKNTHSSFGWNGIIEGMVENILIKNGSIDKKDRFKVRKQIQQQMKESRVQKLFKDSINDAVSLIKGDWFYLRSDDVVFKELFYSVNLYKVIDEQPKSFNGFTSPIIVEKYQVYRGNLRKVGNESIPSHRLDNSNVVKFNSASEAITWLKRQAELVKARKNKDSINDEANLPTTIQALVNDEEAAIKAYEVAIKNLEGKIDETQMQVLINIMKDERRHVENLYAILNGQVTEKNLEDSIHDADYINGKDYDKIMRNDIVRKNKLDVKFRLVNPFARSAKEATYEVTGPDAEKLLEILGK